jgi:hypothetical protein
MMIHARVARGANDSGFFLSDWALVAFTGLLVLFTYRLWKSTEKLWSAGKDQIELAREEFISRLATDHGCE